MDKSKITPVVQPLLGEVIKKITAHPIQSPVIQPIDLSAMRQALKPFFAMQELMTNVVGQLKLIDTSQLEMQIRQIGQQFRELPQIIRDRLSSLLRHGWFIDPDMSFPDIHPLSKFFDSGDVETAEAWLIDYYRGNADTIEQKLLAAFPARATVLSSAFKAHRQGDYALSVPVFLLQADGICQECTGGRQLFSKKDSGGVRGLIKQLPEDDLGRAMLDVFIEDSDLVRNTHELPSDFNGLNRHKVLHGIDSGYGSEVNSLRAMSLLNYSAWAIKDALTQPGASLANGATGSQIDPDK